MLAVLQPDDVAAIVFIDIAIIVAASRVMAAIFRKLHQPAVVGEIVAGLLLGPSLLGAFPGKIPDHIFPVMQVRPALNVVAQLGLIIFMFIVGLELDTTLIRGKARIAAVVSASSVALPFMMGLVLALDLHHSHELVRKDKPVPFALFLGASMSVTAFPVLARILVERGMNHTRIGALALACAAVDDILAWSLLAVVLAEVNSNHAWDLPRILVESAAFVTFMFVVVRPRLKSVLTWYTRAGQLTPNVLAVIVVGFLSAAFVTSKIGIHSIFGAFIFGVIMPREDSSALFHDILERLEQVSVLLLLPVFFVITGLNVNVRGLGPDAFTQLPLILLVACAGKFLGASAAAKAQGLGIRQSAAIGILMNTRGLTELVILNVGREAGVLDDRLFTMLVVMAIVTTIITEPLLRLVYSDETLERERREAEGRTLGSAKYRILVVMDDAPASGALIDAGTLLATSESPAEIVLTRLRRSRRTPEVGSGLITELAEMTDSLEMLNVQAERIRARGIGCVVRSHFSDDIARDVTDMASSVFADAVMMRSDASGDEPLLAMTKERAPWEWIVLTADSAAIDIPDADNPIVVYARGDSSDVAAAYETAARLAISTGAAIQMVGAADTKSRRQAERFVARATKAGLTTSVLEEGEHLAVGNAAVRPRRSASGEAGLSAGRSQGGWELRVRAARDADDERIERLLGTIAHEEPDVLPEA